jgi:hypothetical protein
VRIQSPTQKRKKEVDGVFFFLFSSTPQQQTSFFDRPRADQQPKQKKV